MLVLRVLVLVSLVVFSVGVIVGYCVSIDVGMGINDNVCVGAISNGGSYSIGIGVIGGFSVVIIVGLCVSADISICVNDDDCG